MTGDTGSGTFSQAEVAQIVIERVDSALHYGPSGERRWLADFYSTRSLENGISDRLQR